MLYQQIFVIKIIPAFDMREQLAKVGFFSFSQDIPHQS